MKRLICAALAALAIVATLPAQQVPPGTQWSGAGYYDLKSHNVSAVALTTVHTFTGLLGKPAWSLDLDAFAGVTARSGSSQQAIGGFSLGKRFPLAQGIGLYGGLAATFSNRQPVGFGLIAGASIRF